MRLLILLEVELAALPRHTGKRFRKSFANPLVVITGDAVGAIHSSGYKAFENALQCSDAS